MPAQHLYNPRTSGYNENSAAMRSMRAKQFLLMDGAADLHAVGYGDSTMIGYYGTVGSYDWDHNVWRQACRRWASNLGVTFQGGIQLMAGDSTPHFVDNVSGTGSFVASSLFASSNGAGTLTWVTKDAGTRVELAVSDLTTATWSWTVDGVAQTNVTNTNTNTIKKVTSNTVLANTTHTVVVTSTAGQVLIVTGGRCYDPTVKRLHCHVLAVGGARANGGTNNINFSSTSNVSTYGMGWVLPQTLAAFGVTPDLLAVSIAANDAAAASPAATAATGIDNMFGYSSTSPGFLIGSYMVGGTNAALWDQYINMRVARADARGIPFFDWDGYVGRLAGATADGLIGADGTHPTVAHMRGVGLHLGDLLTA